MLAYPPLVLTVARQLKSARFKGRCGVGIPHTCAMGKEAYSNDAPRAGCEMNRDRIHDIVELELEHRIRGVSVDDASNRANDCSSPRLHKRRPCMRSQLTAHGAPPATLPSNRTADCCTRQSALPAQMSAPETQASRKYIGRTRGCVPATMATQPASRPSVLCPMFMSNLL
jgi:hypothetical protein